MKGRAQVLVALPAIAALLAVVDAGLQARLQTEAPPRTAHLFPPEDLGLLESPDRADWQKPDQIMDALAIADGSKVADVGAGSGWFTMQLARRVGPNGLVYAEDVQRQMIEAIRRRVGREGLQNVRAVQGTVTDPRLPEGSLDAAVVVDVYSEVDNRVMFLRTLSRALKPNGRIGVVNYKPGQGGPGPSSNANEGVRVDSSMVEADARAAGLRVLARANLPFQYLLVLGK
ncbi:MAG TPA: class I SAM-dependent methyltransferase [Vicinamibacterales bacterium]|jgi:predicted methyltransferase|nr:class I SAM-dependent methyltransferase [Vicinamibacterales bacterium]